MKPKKPLLNEDLATLVKKFASSDVVATMARQYSSSAQKQAPLSQIDDNRRLAHLDISPTELQKAIDGIKSGRELAPLIVRPIGDRYEIILGRRRYKAAQEAGLTTLPLVVQAVEDAEMMLTIIANLRDSRETNALSIATLSKALQREFGYTQASLAAVTHVSRPTIANMMRLLQLPPRAQQELTRGNISYGHARALINIDPSSIDTLVSEVIAHKLSVRQLETIVRLTRSSSLEEALHLFRKPLTGCLKVGRKRVTIEFENETELQKFVKRLQRRKWL